MPHLAHAAIVQRSLREKLQTHLGLILTAVAKVSKDPKLHGDIVFLTVGGNYVVGKEGDGGGQDIQIVHQQRRCKFYRQLHPCRGKGRRHRDEQEQDDICDRLMPKIIF